MDDLKVKHYDAGLGTRLRKLQKECPSLLDEETFTRFLEALGQHISQSIHHDSGSHPWLNWWTGEKDKYYWDAGHQAPFDLKGVQRLAKSLAERTFKLLRLHRVLEDSKYLGKRVHSEEIEGESLETATPEEQSSTALKRNMTKNEDKDRPKSTAWEVETWRPLARLTQDQHL